MKKIYCTLILLATIATGCEDITGVDDLNKFDITLANTPEIDPATGAYVINLNDTIKFQFQGEKVDNIVFYSGTMGEEYRYRNRYVADKDAILKPQIRIKTGAVNWVGGTADPYRYEFAVAFDKDIPGLTNDSVASANWTAYPLRSTNTSTGLQLTEYFDYNTGMSKANGTFDYTNWYSHDEVMYCIRAKSNMSELNKLQLQEFYVSNTETRDYGYTYNGVTVTNTPSKEYIIFKDYSILDSNLKVSNSDTGACWAMYTPATTTKEGESSPVANSQYYAWNAAELGLKYGEYSETYPWITTNKFGQAIKGGYSVEIWTPNQNIKDKDGNPILDSEGNAITAPTTDMKNEPCESWLISNRHNVHKVTPDSPTNYIKTKIQSMMSNFSYTYVKKGKGLYTATFYVNNQNVDKTNEYTKEFKFLVK